MMQQQIDHIVEILKEKIYPLCNELDRSNMRISRDIFRICGEAGLFSLIVPKTLGGSGFDFCCSAALVKEFMRSGLLGFSSSIMIQSNTICTLIARHASPYVQETFLTPLMQGTQIGALAVTETTVGSDLVNAIQTAAHQDGNDWVINGTKMFITNGPIADLHVVLARTSDNGSVFDLTMIIVPSDTPGFQVVRDIEKLGQHLSPIGELSFENCRVPIENTVGFIGKGYLISADVLNEERVLIGIGAIALAKQCFDETLKTLRDKKLLSHQVIRHELSHMMADLTIAENYGDYVAKSIAERNTNVSQCGIVKFELVSIAQKIIEQCMRLLGAESLLDKHWANSAYLDSRVLSVYAGSSETMKDIVGRKVINEVNLF